MIELAPDLMATLQVEAERQGKTVSEIVAKAIKEWIDPEPWFDINGPMEPARRVTLPVEGAAYWSADGEFSILMKAIELAYEPVPPPAILTIAYPGEGMGEQWEEVRITGEDWMEMVDKFGFAQEIAQVDGAG